MRRPLEPLAFVVTVLASALPGCVEAPARPVSPDGAAPPAPAAPALPPEAQPAGAQPGLPVSEMVIAPWKSPCSHGEAFHGLCMTVQSPPGSPWQDLPARIEGFKPRWGHQYRIKMTTRKLPPNEIKEDGPSEIHKLVSIESDTLAQAGETFTLSIDTHLEALGWPALVDFDADGAGGRFNDHHHFFCAQPDDCKAIHRLMKRSMSEVQADRSRPTLYKASFSFGPTSGNPLTLVSLSPKP